MASGTLRNLETSAFVRTPPSVVRDILRHLLAVRDSAAPLMFLDALDRAEHDTFTVFDPTCGEGDFLLPLAGFPRCRLYGVEISRERADEARRHVPTALIVTSAFEATRIPPQTMSLVLTNPPYMVANGVRLEYSVIRDAGETLVPDGIMVAVIPARQWDGTMANHWAKHYTHVRAWKFRDNDPDRDEEAFDHYTQIVVIGVRRATPLDSPDPVEKARIRGWRWRAPEKADDAPWAQGFAPDDLPIAPITDPYFVPATTATPTITALKADDALLLKGLETSGAHLMPLWQAATRWQETACIERPLMPPTGTAHLAADILTGLFDGEIVAGPDGLPYVFTTYVTTEMVSIEVDEDARAKHVTRILQQQDKAVLGVLNLTTGDVRYYQGDEAFAFLTPWLPTLAAQVLARRDPIYKLDPADWQLGVVARIGIDKTLPGTKHAGLAVPQMHRAFALYRGVCELKKVAIQGEPGTGKTRMSTALFAQMAYRWQHRDTIFKGQQQPRWMRRLKRAWKTNPFTNGDAPKALPLLVATPKRVMPVWEEELAAAWPGVEVMVIETHHDVRRWMDRCAVASAPAVVAIFPHSLTRPGRVTWRPAVIEQQQTVKIPNLTPPTELMDQLEPVYEKGASAGGKVIAYRFKATGVLLEQDEVQSIFVCPDCGTLVEAEPRSLHKAAPDTADTDAAEAASTKEDKLQPVQSITFFAKKQQRCRHCTAPLWARAWSPATEAKYPAPSFAKWSQAVEHLVSVPMPKPSKGKQGVPRVRITKTGLGACELGPAIPDSFSPYAYLLEFFGGCVANAIIDESHNGRGRDTDIAQAIHQATRAAQTYIYASGTHYGGSIGDFFFYWYRFDPSFWRKLGMVFVEQNDIRDTAKRLSWVLSVFNPWTLPNSVDPEDREAAIKAAVAAGRGVVIVPYRRVSEGLNLQCIDSVIWYEMAMNLFHLDQASRRAWRLGKRELVRLYYLVYARTVAHKKLHKLGSQSGAATLFAGDTPDGELVRHAGADKTTLAKLSQGLHEREEDLKVAFDRRSKELAAALKKGREWIGVTDTLPERLAALRTRTVAAPLVEDVVSEGEAHRDALVHATLVVETALSVAEETYEEIVVSAPQLDLPCAAPARSARQLVQFGDMAAIDSALRRARKVRRAASPAAATMGQLDMLGEMFGEAAITPAALARKCQVASADSPIQASMV